MDEKIGVLSRHPGARHEQKVFTFTEHCRDGGADFLEYLKPWHMEDALGVINDAAQNYTPERAIPLIKQALEELFTIAAQRYREALEWERVE